MIMFKAQLLYRKLHPKQIDVNKERSIDTNLQKKIFLRKVNVNNNRKYTYLARKEKKKRGRGRHKLV